MSVGIGIIFVNIIVCSIFGFIIGPVVNNVGYKFNILDFPNSRKIHKTPIVRIGGLTIFLTFFLFNFIYYLFFRFSDFYIYESKDISIILVGSLSFFLLGLHDDIFRSSPVSRLVIQFSIAFALSLFGINISNLSLTLPFLGYVEFTLPLYLSHIATCFWIVGITNALNWLDGLDGLASGYALFTSVAILISSILVGSTSGIILFSLLSGAIIGFLIRNFRPAFYIMGDCGSYFLGFCLSVGAIYFPSKESINSLPIVYLVILFSLPILDMLFVIFNRIYKKQNPLKADANHIHHRMMRANIPYKGIILLTYSYSFLTSSLANIILKK